MKKQLACIFAVLFMTAACVKEKTNYEIKIEDNYNFQLVDLKQVQEDMIVKVSNLCGEKLEVEKGRQCELENLQVREYEDKEGWNLLFIDQHFEESFLDSLYISVRDEQFSLHFFNRQSHEIEFSAVYDENFGLQMWYGNYGSNYRWDTSSQSGKALDHVAFRTNFICENEDELQKCLSEDKIVFEETFTLLESRLAQIEIDIEDYFALSDCRKLIEDTFDLLEKM